MSSDVKLAVLGAGKLGAALIEGVLRTEWVSRNGIRATVSTEERAGRLSARWGIEVTSGGNAEAVYAADIVILAVKPNQAAAVMTEIGQVLNQRHVLVSLAAAVSLKKLESFLGEPITVFRAMPNLAMTVGQSGTAVCSNARATADQKKAVRQIFETVGSVFTVDEEMMHAVTALSGSGPAYVALMVEGVAAGAVKLGLPAGIAMRLAEQTFFGCAKLLLERNVHPAVLSDEVTTPAGTTVAGLHELERGAVRAALMSAVEAAGQRSKEIQATLDQIEGE